MAFVTSDGKYLVGSAAKRERHRQLGMPASPTASPLYPWLKGLCIGLAVAAVIGRLSGV